MKDLLISSSALICAVLLIRLLFCRLISRRAQYALWLIVLLRLLIPFSLPAVSHNVLTAAEPVRETISETVERPVYRLPYASYPVTDYTPEELPDPQPGAVLSEGEGSYGVVDESGEDVVFYRERIKPAQLLRIVWYAGMAAMALWLIAANLRFSHRLRRTRVPLEGVVSRYPAYLCDDVPSPCLFGLFRPTVYVTSEAARELRRLRYVLAHEETHARQLDPLWSLLRGVCLVVWWFNPLVWLAAYCSRADCELACDEGTLARLGEAERVAYGETLLALIPRRRGEGPMVAATTMTAGKRRLRERVKRIAEHRKPVAIALVLALVLALAACAATFTGATGKETPEPDATTSPAPTETAQPTAPPEGEAFAVIPLDALTPCEPETIELGEAWKYFIRRHQGASTQDGVSVHIYVGRDRRVYAAVDESDENYVFTARPFLTLSQNANAEESGISVFHDLFGCEEGLVISYTSAVQNVYYGQCWDFFSFAADGTPTRLASIWGNAFFVTDLDGDGTNELVSDGSDLLYFQRDGVIYRAEVEALLAPYLDDLVETSASFDEAAKCLCVFGWKDGKLCAFYVHFDGGRLLVWQGPERELSEQIAADEGTPEALIALAAQRGAAAAQEMLRLQEGPYSPAIWMDGWRATLRLCGTAERERGTIEVWNLTMDYHASAPERVFYAGGTHVTDDNWVVGWYDPQPYLFTLVGADGARRVLDGGVGWEFGPGNEVMFPVVLDWIELRNGLRGPEEIDGESLWMMFHLLGAADMLNVLGKTDPAVRTDALRRLVEGADAHGEPDSLAMMLAESGSSASFQERLTEEGRTALEELRTLAGA